MYLVYDFHNKYKYIKSVQSLEINQSKQASLFYHIAMW